MTISFVVAMDRNRVIGKNNKLPWNMPADFKRMRKLTDGKPLIMGRKTHESIGRPLPNRKNIIITRDRNYKSEGCVVVNTKEDALKKARGYDEIIIFGGSEIYKMFMDVADKMYLTVIEHKFDGDAYFPEYDDKKWKVVEKEEHKSDDDNRYDYTFLTLARN